MDFSSSNFLQSVLQNYRTVNMGDFTSNPEPTNANRLLSEIQLISLNKFDSHLRIRIGGLVMAKSVKFLGKLETTLSDQETREGWWEELRDEIRSHAKTLCCTHVVGYRESCTIFGDVCILSALGTAATLKGGVHPNILKNLYDSIELYDNEPSNSFDDNSSIKRFILILFI